MKMKLKVVDKANTPKNAMRRAVLSRDDSTQGWVRDDADMAFMLWSSCRDFRSDRIYDKERKMMVEVDSPFVETLDEDGYGTGDYELRKDVIAFGVDVYDHSGIAYALHGEGACFDRWDTSSNLLWLWTDKERWDSLGGSCEWKFVDGKPTDELLEAAREIARGEIEGMNLCECGSYYGYEVEDREIHHEKTEITFDDGREPETYEKDVDEWVGGYDSCWGTLTDEPARDCGFPLGIPVVSDESYLVGSVFEQECFAFVDKTTGRYLHFKFDAAAAEYSIKEVDNPKDALLQGEEFLNRNLEKYEKDFGRELEVREVTEEVWRNYPECIA